MNASDTPKQKPIRIDMPKLVQISNIARTIMLINAHDNPTKQNNKNCFEKMDLSIFNFSS